MTHNSGNDTKENMNFPWFTYPSLPLSGYNNTELYKKELVRLEYALNELRLYQHKILFHLTIGSPIEENSSHELKRKDVRCQMHQMIPDHLIKCAKLGIECINFIVCPNIINEPIFTILTNNFIKIDSMNYKHKKIPLNIMIFNTMMPTSDIVRNNNFIERNRILEPHIFEMIFPDGIEKYIQTDYDQSIISQFYNQLQQTIGTITLNGGYCSCFSFAVFNASGCYHSLNGYKMFREIIYCYDSHKYNNTILCEWIFENGNYCVYKHPYDTSDAKNVSICYVPSHIIKKTQIYIENMSEIVFIKPEIRTYAVVFDIM